MNRIRVGLRKKVVVTIAIVCALLGVGVWLFVTQWYLPMRDAAPIVKLLKSGTRKDIDAADLLIRGLRYENYSDGRSNMVKDPNRIVLRGIGAAKVKKGILDALNTTEDSESMFSLFASIGIGDEETTLGFRDKMDWQIIAKATERYNAKQKEGAGTFYISTNASGQCYLNGTGQVIP